MGNSSNVDWPINLTLADVASEFAALPESATKYSAFKHSDANQSVHLQGMSWYETSPGYYIILTHNQSDGPGYMVIGDVRDKSQTNFEFPKDIVHNWHHPGGIQVIGSYVVVSYQPSEGDHGSGRVHLWKLDGRNDPKIQNPIPIIELSNDIACCGIASNPVRNCYTLAVYSSGTGKVSLYDSNGSIAQGQNLKWNLKISSKLSNGYDNIALIGQTDQKLYMIGFNGKDDGASIADWADLYFLDTYPAPGSYEFKLIQSRHFYNTGGLAGEMGPHFRWGAGASVIPTAAGNKLSIYCSSRHFEPTIDMVMNYWGASFLDR